MKYHCVRANGKAYNFLPAMEVDDSDDLDQFSDQEVLKKRIAEKIASKDRAHWIEVAKKYPNSCLSPILSLDEAAKQEHAKTNNSYIEKDDGYEPRPVPKEISALANSKKSPDDPKFGGHTSEVLKGLLSLSSTEIENLHKENVIDCTTLSAKL